MLKLGYNNYHKKPPNYNGNKIEIYLPLNSEDEVEKILNNQTNLDNINIIVGTKSNKVI